MAATLLAQLHLPTHDYVWSRNLLVPHARDFAWYCYNNGFGAVSAQGTVTFDNVSRKVVDRDRAVPAKQLQLGQAMEQLTGADFARR